MIEERLKNEDKQRGKTMRKLILAILVAACMGCAQEYAPPPEAFDGWLMPDGSHFDKTTGKSCETSKCHS